MKVIHVTALFEVRTNISINVNKIICFYECDKNEKEKYTTVVLPQQNILVDMPYGDFKGLYLSMLSS